MELLSPTPLFWFELLAAGTLFFYLVVWVIKKAAQNKTLRYCLAAFMSIIFMVAVLFLSLLFAVHHD